MEKKLVQYQLIIIGNYSSNYLVLLAYWSRFQTGSIFSLVCIEYSDISEVRKQEEEGEKSHILKL